MKIEKRYFILIIMIVFVAFLVWKVSTSFALVDIGYSGRNIVTGDKWGVNITDVGEATKVNNAVLTSDVSTIGTTLNFNARLFKPGDKISFDITISNTGSLDAELYALTLQGLSEEDSEVITYTILPIDSSYVHEDNKDGSIIKKGEKQKFNITVSYDDGKENGKEYNLSLGSTIVYKQK